MLNLLPPGVISQTSLSFLTKWGTRSRWDLAFCVVLVNLNEKVAQTKSKTDSFPLYAEFVGGQNPTPFDVNSRSLRFSLKRVTCCPILVVAVSAASRATRKICGFYTASTGFVEAFFRRVFNPCSWAEEMPVKVVICDVSCCVSLTCFHPPLSLFWTCTQKQILYDNVWWI